MSAKIVFEENGSVFEVKLDAYAYSIQAAKKEGDPKTFEVSGNIKFLKPWTPIAPVA